VNWELWIVVGASGFVAQGTEIQLVPWSCFIFFWYILEWRRGGDGVGSSAGAKRIKVCATFMPRQPPRPRPPPSVSPCRRSPRTLCRRSAGRRRRR